MKPITTRIKEARQTVKLPKGMEISVSADGHGGAVPEYNTDPAICKCKKPKCKCGTK